MLKSNVLHMIYHRWVCAFCGRKHNQRSLANKYDDTGDLYCPWSCYDEDDK